jgi:hypothetical protein
LQLESGGRSRGCGTVYLVTSVLYLGVFTFSCICVTFQLKKKKEKKKETKGYHGTQEL